MKINSHNEWDKLLEVIVGSAQGSHAVTTWARPDPIPPKILEEALRLNHLSHPQWLIEEIAEDLQGLADTLASFGVKVHRPKIHDIGKMFATPFWQSTGNDVYNVRDLHLVVGNTVIESPSYLRSRYFESLAFYDIWYEYFEEGFKWVCGPRPRIDRPVSEPYYRDESQRKLTEEDIRYQNLTGGRLEKLHRLNENEIVFEAANTLRLGHDLLYLVSSSGNYKSAKWLQTVLGTDYRVHTTEDIYRSSHIDSTVLALRPGLVMLNSTRVNQDNCPPIFEKWHKIWFEDVAPTPQTELDFQKTVRDPLAKQLEAMGFETNLNDMASPWVGMNFLSIDPHTVLVDERQIALMKVLERHQIMPVPVRMRHMHTQSGGIHCTTLDTVRESKLERYFD